AGIQSAEELGARLRGDDEPQWCERRLLARLHRYTREKQRSEIQAVPPAQFLRFLFRWQGIAGAAADERREGEDGLLAVLRQLEGFAVPAGAWEDAVLAPRVRLALPALLARLCAAGRIVWFRHADGADPERR